MSAAATTIRRCQRQIINVIINRRSPRRRHYQRTKTPAGRPRPLFHCTTDWCWGNCLKLDAFGRPFVKRFALCYRTAVCPVCLSVCDVGVLWPNGWMDQDETWHGGRPRPRPHCVRSGPSSPHRGTAPNFRPMSVVAKRLDGLRCHLVWR